MSGDGEVRLLMSAGRGPVECAWAVAQLLRRLEAQAGDAGLGLRRIEIVPGAEPGTYLSVLLGLSGAGAGAFARTWSGTLCWQAPSPYRPGHPRKNWFVIARQQQEVPSRGLFAEADVDLVACRTGGPGGQHRNKASTAVRATHRPTGIVVVVDTERQFSANRRLALQRLRQRIEQGNEVAQRSATAARWVTHDQLIRGNPSRIERPEAPVAPSRPRSPRPRVRDVESATEVNGW